MSDGSDDMSDAGQAPPACTACGEVLEFGLYTSVVITEGPQAGVYHSRCEPSMPASRRVRFDVCDCEYPCSCVELDGVRYGSWKAVLDALDARLTAVREALEQGGLVYTTASLDRIIDLTRSDITAPTPAPDCTCVPAMEGEGYLISIECPIHGRPAPDITAPPSDSRS